MSDDGLLEAARQYSRQLLNFFRRQGVSPSEAEDLLQETYLRLWKYRHRYEPKAKLSTFLFILARQVRLDAFRNSARRAAREESWGDADRMRRSCKRLDPCVREDVEWALSRLPDAMRETVELVVFQDMRYADAAKVLGVPPGTVKSRVFNALKKLKEIFDERRS